MGEVLDMVVHDRGREPFCDFCGKWRELVKVLVKGPNGVCICEECIALCAEIVAEKEVEAKALK